MVGIKKQLGSEEKLKILTRDSCYDLACACATTRDEHRTRSKEDKWIYPVTLPQGGTTYLFKTLLSNECVNDCRYCPLRLGCDPQRCRLKPEELVRVFLDYYRKGKVQGLFLSSGVINSPDATMERINRVGRILRNSRFRGYLHLKVIPGASDAAVRETLSLASTVSLNIETAGKDHFAKLSRSKNYEQDIIRPIKLISRLTGRGAPFSRVKQTTQFVVGASDETDKEVVGYSWSLYKKLGLHRIYFSAYQRGLGDRSLPGERSSPANADMLTREHRLYQADWLIRKYGFTAEEIPFEKDGNLSLTSDPKEMWALRHPERFPVEVNKADKLELLRVPGLGEITVQRILKIRSAGKKIREINDLGPEGKRLRKAAAYLKFSF